MKSQAAFSFDEVFAEFGFYLAEEISHIAPIARSAGMVPAIDVLIIDATSALES